MTEPLTDDPNDFQTPGDAIRLALQQRGWTQAVLAKVLSRPLPTINEIIQGKRGILPEMASQLAAAFGNSARFWMELDGKHRRSFLPEMQDEVRRRAAIYGRAPVEDMIRRGWITAGKSDDDLELQLLEFYGVDSLEQEPTIVVDARKSAPDEPFDKNQLAWVCRARQVAAAMVVSEFRDESSQMDALVARLRRLAAYPKEATRVGDTLREFGIRFVVVEPLSGCRIDGAAFWLDERAPVIAVSLRADRVDGFWFTLMHEISHIRHRDAMSVDSRLVGEDLELSRMKSVVERRADEEAAEALLERGELESFILRTRPLYSKTRIIQFAHRVKIHPGIIVGQLQHRGEMSYASNREMLAKVRTLVTSTAITDGWGHVVGQDI